MYLRSIIQFTTIIGCVLIASIGNANSDTKKKLSELEHCESRSNKDPGESKDEIDNSKMFIDSCKSYLESLVAYREAAKRINPPTENPNKINDKITIKSAKDSVSAAKCDLTDNFKIGCDGKPHCRITIDDNICDDAKEMVVDYVCFTKWVADFTGKDVPKPRQKTIPIKRDTFAVSLFCAPG